MMQSGKKVLWIVLGLVIAVVVLIGILLWATNPTRTANKFNKLVQDGNYDGAFAMVATDISSDKVDNIDYFVDDWTSAEDITIEVTAEEAWLQRTKVDANGNIVLNEHGDRDVEIKPTPKYWAHFYQAYMTVEFDDLEDPVIVRLRRKSADGWSPIAQIFRGWEVTKIVYQPLDEDEYEDLDFEELFEIEETELEEDVESDVTEEDTAVEDETTTDEDTLSEEEELQLEIDTESEVEAETGEYDITIDL